MCGILCNPTNDVNQPVIILHHGFTSSKNNVKMLTLEKIFNQHNISSFRIDAYGHGESDGKFEDITVTKGVDGILYAIKYLKKQGYAKIGLVGSSFGGLCSILAAAQINDLFVLGLTAPVSDYTEVEQRKRSKENIEEWKRRGFDFAPRNNGEMLKLNYTYYNDFKNNIAYDVANKITIPTLIVHGDVDKVVPLEQSKKTARLIPHCKLVVIKGAGHFYTDEKNMIKSISEFIIEHCN